MTLPRRLALKVDCDTFHGTKEGIPKLLRLFEEFHIKASFFFTLGPDRSGRAIRRIFTQKGFLSKMFRSKAVSLYGPKTILYGTLLPAPHIGKSCGDIFRSVKAAGHDVGVHAWDHVHWHDHLDRMSASEIESDYSSAHDQFEEIFKTRAQSSAAPGWHATPSYLLLQEKFRLLYTSNTRRGAPYFPLVGETRLGTLEIPTTLPTWDEALADPTLDKPTDLIDRYRQLIQKSEVHTLHTEVEGMKYAELFRKQLQAWKEESVQFLTLKDYAEELLLKKESLPFHVPTRISVPQRGGLVSSSLPSTSFEVSRQ